MQTIYGDKEILIEHNRSIDNMDDMIVRLYVGRVLIATFNKGGTGDAKALREQTAFVYSYLLEPETYSVYGVVDVFIETKEAETKWTDDVKNKIHPFIGAYKIAQRPWA